MQESLEASLVRIRTTDGGVVGAGFLVGERQILTCAHVVAGALGLADDTPEKPQAPVSLDIPRVAAGQLLTARVVLWRPPRADGGDDIAGLELEDDPPRGAQAAPLAQVEDLWEHSFRAFGFPRGQDSGVWATGRLLGRQVTNWVQIEDVKETGFSVEPGFSGTPVWDSQVEAAVGMVVAAERHMNLKTAFAIPVDVLAASWPLLESLIHPFVFLCYARADSEPVTRLRTDLLNQGIHVWIDREGLQPGTLDWEEALRTAIRAAQAVLLIASPHARSSRYVRDELRIAEMYQRPVYPLWIAGTHWMDAVPLGWGGAQYIDARQSRYETALPELVEILNKASSAPPKPPELDFEPRNPYKGLHAFTGEDAHDFFGRDTLIDELAATLEGALASEEKNRQCSRLLAVVGPSGSGKSSVVMAGLLPRLREGRLLGSERWVYLDPIMPGTRPIEALTLALSEHLPDKSLKAIREDLEDDSARGLHLLATRLAKRPGTKVVLLVDQFEELFTQTSSEDERRHFLDLLVTATTEPHGPVIVLLTLRADFYDRPMRYPVLHQLMQAHQTSVLPMAIPELREVIEKPAALPDVQLTFEGDLVGDLLFEVQGQVGALPLLQFTLDQLFQRRNGSQLTLSAYREIGGVKGALARQAESIYAALPSEKHRTLARSLFLRLIDPGVTEQDTTRRRAALAELSLPDPEQTAIIQETADAFIAARLLTTNVFAGTTTIEVSHEALIREWARLSEWLREAREDITLQQAISEDATEWMQRGKPIDRLYRGTQLAEAQEWTERNVPSKDEAAFLQASVIERQRQETAEQSRQARELNLQRRVVSRQRLLIAVLCIFSVVVIILASVAEANFLQAQAQQKQAELEARIALSHALAANADYSLSQNELDRALLLSVKALQTYNTYEARSSLLRALEQSPRIITMLHAHPIGIGGTLAFTANGSSLVLFNGGSDIDVWDTKAKTYHTLPLVAQTYGTSLISVALSPTDQTMVTAGQAGVWLWDIQTGTQLAQLAGRTATDPGLTSTAFSSDGKVVASSRCTKYSVIGCATSQILLWNVTSKQPIGSPLVVRGDVFNLALSPDHQMLAYTPTASFLYNSSVYTGLTAVQLWNVATGQSIGPLVGDKANLTRSATFSPDGKILATTNSDDTLQLWDVVSRRPIGFPLVGHTDRVNDIAFSPDGKTLASCSSDGTVRLWDVAFDRLIGSALISNPEGQESVAFSPDGKTLASAGARGTITIWNIATNGSPISQRYNYTVGVDSVVFSPDGTIIVGTEDGHIFLQDSKTGERIGTLDTTIYPPRKMKLQPGDNNLLSIQSQALSRDGHILASGRLDGTIILWNLQTRKPFAQFTYTNLLRKILLSTDGQTLVASGDGNTFMLWNVGKRTAIHIRSYQFQIGSLALSANGRLLALGVCSRGKDNTSCSKQQIMLWDVVTDTLFDRVSQGGGDFILDLAFSPDGNTLTWSSPAGIALWNVTTRKSIGQTLSPSYDHIAFSSDGKILVSYTIYSSFILWNVTTSEPFTSPIMEGAYLGQLNGVALSPDGQQLVSVGFAGSVSPGETGRGWYPNQSIVTLWNISLASWENQACSIANRNLTRDEWRQFVGSEPFAKVCPDLPLP